MKAACAGGTGWGTAQSPKLNEIEVVMKQRAKGIEHRVVKSDSTLYSLRPTLWLTGQAKSICRKLKVIKTHLSLTHTKDYAMAVVILEKK